MDAINKAMAIIANDNSAVGFIIRNSDMKPVIIPRSQPQEYTSVLQAEAMVLKQALIWASRMKFSKVKIERDSKILIPIITNKTQLPWSIQSIA